MRIGKPDYCFTTQSAGDGDHQHLECDTTHLSYIQTSLPKSCGFFSRVFGHCTQ
jgi:hypothetical protein